MKRTIIYLVTSLTIAVACSGQDKPSSKYQLIGFSQYLRLVSEKNLEYAAEKYNIDISEAKVEMAKVIPNPSFSVSMANSSDGEMSLGNELSSEISTTVELGGKRKARIDVANKELQLSKALVNDYFRNLRADAAHTYLEAVKEMQLYQIVVDSYETMKRLSEADSIRLLSGSIMKTDAIQSKLEAGVLYNDLILVKVNLDNAIVEMQFMATNKDIGSAMRPVDTLPDLSRKYELQDLIDLGLVNRSDLEAARFTQDLALSTSNMVRRERKLDLELFLGYNHGYPNPDTDPMPSTVSGGVAIPIKLSNFNKGDLQMAKVNELKAEHLHSLIELKIVTEITQAYHFFNSAARQVENYQNNLLNQSEELLQGKIYSYQRGETSLLEVLAAQRTFNEIQKTYIETIHNSYVALITLETAAGIWDIDF